MFVLVLNLFVYCLRGFFNSFLDFSANGNWITPVKPFK